VDFSVGSHVTDKIKRISGIGLAKQKQMCFPEFTELWRGGCLIVPAKK